MSNKTVLSKKTNIKVKKKQTKLGKIISYSIGAILIILVGLYVFGFNSYVIQTNSMDPIIYGSTDGGDTVIINKMSSLDNLVQYDIIAFYADLDGDGDTEVVVHYVYSIEEIDGETVIRTVRHNIDNDGLTLFDLTDEEIIDEIDDWILSEDDIVGKLATVIKNETLGSVLLFASSTIGRIVLLVDLVAIYLLIEYVSEPKNKKAETKESDNENEEKPEE